MPEVYHDRRMLKWLPFQSLPEQGDDLRAIYDGLTYQEKPTLSQDQYDIMQYTFEACYHTQTPVKLTLFKNGHKHSKNGLIIGFDQTYGMIILNTGTVMKQDIIDIEQL
ncbi:MAG: YolD-like family protein [Bacillota bacterium]